MTTPVPSSSTAPSPRLSIVVPALNEAENLRALVEQVDRSVRGQGVHVELIIVDDGSSDDSPARLAALMRDHPWLRVLRHERPLGQSRAMYDGIAAARGPFIATLDADLQNDPADLPEMLLLIERGEADMVQGDRSANRRDNFIRRRTSWVGRATRRALLGDSVRDTGCSARVVRAQIARQFPLQFKGMHRFLPAYAKMLGARIVERPVHHRPRLAGQTKYGLGVFSRALPGLIDCLAMRWMISRHRPGRVTELNGRAGP